MVSESQLRYGVFTNRETGKVSRVTSNLLFKGLGRQLSVSGFLMLRVGRNDTQGCILSDEPGLGKTGAFITLLIAQRWINIIRADMKKHPHWHLFQWIDGSVYPSPWLFE